MSMEATDQANHNTVEMVFDGEVVDTFDFANLTDDQIKRIKQGYEKGLLYNKKMHSLGAIEGKAKQFDDLQKVIGAVREGQLDKGVLLDTFKSYGIDLTPAQKEELESDAFDDGTLKVLKGMQKELETTKRELNSIKQQSMASGIDQAHRTLAGKYNGKNGWPVYDANEVEHYLMENPMYSPDPIKNYEAAYKLMNEEKIMIARQKEWEEGSKRDKDRRKSAFSESGEGTVNLNTDKITVKGKSWDEIEKLALAKYGAAIEEALEAIDD